MTQFNEYRPAYLEFNVAIDETIVPSNLGEFKTAKEATEFMAKQVTGINQKVTVSRFMDNFEKTEMRREYNDIMENKLPIVEKEMLKALNTFNEAKRNLDDAKDFLNATISEAKLMAVEVKRGLKDITLDDMTTWKVPYNGQYFFYTYIDGLIRLVTIRDIPEFEKQELFNAMNRNDEFFTTDKKSDPEIKPVKKSKK